MPGGEGGAPSRRISRNELISPLAFEGRRARTISERTPVTLALGVVVGVGLFLCILMWRISSQVQHINDRVLVTERTLRIVAKKVGVETIDLEPLRDDPEH